MTRTQIQTQLDVIKENPAYDGSIGYVTTQMATWLSSQGVSDSDSQKIQDDLLSYAY